MTELFAHQKEGIAFLQQKRRAILADEMGLGKTRQAVLAAMGTPGRILVVCPATLKENWRREITEVDHDADVFVVSPGPEHTLPAAEWTIVNYDMLPKYKRQLKAAVKGGGIGTVVVDEAHYIKGKSTERSKATLEVAEAAGSVYLLTGTPVLNRPAELFNMLRAIGHPLGESRPTFVKKFCGGQLKAMIQDLATGARFFVDPARSFGYRWPHYRRIMFVDETGATHLDELREAVGGSILRRTKDEVLDLPEKIVQEVAVDLSPEHRRSYEGAWEAYLEWVGGNPDASRNMDNIKSAQQLIELGKLKQVCSAAKVARIAADVENAVEQGGKVIVFSQYTRTIEELVERFREAKLGPVAVVGGQTQEQRQEAVDLFQKDRETRVLVANIKAGGVGITLTAASVVAFADFDWSPKVNEQAEDRAHRIGQAGTVNVLYYVCRDTIEGEILESLRRKSLIIGDILGEKATNTPGIDSI